MFTMAVYNGGCLRLSLSCLLDQHGARIHIYIYIYTTADYNRNCSRHKTSTVPGFTFTTAGRLQQGHHDQTVAQSVTAELRDYRNHVCLRDGPGWIATFGFLQRDHRSPVKDL